MNTFPRILALIQIGLTSLCATEVSENTVLPDMEAEILQHLQQNDLAKFEFNPWLKVRASSGKPDVLFHQKVTGASWSTSQLPASIEINLGKPFSVSAFYVEDTVWQNHGAGAYEILVYDAAQNNFVPTNPPARFEMVTEMNGHRKILSFTPVVTEKIKFIAKKGRGKQADAFFLKRLSVLPEFTPGLKYYQDFLIANYEASPAESNWIGQWIWDADVRAKSVSFRKDFEVEGEIESADIQGNAKNDIHIKINNSSIYNGAGNPTLALRGMEEHFQPGSNRITIDVANHQWPGGLILEVLLRMKDGRRIILATDETWLTSQVKNEWVSTNRAKLLTKDITSRWRNQPVYDFSRPEIKILTADIPSQVAAGETFTAKLNIVPSKEESLPKQVKINLLDAEGVSAIETNATAAADINNKTLPQSPQSPQSPPSDTQTLTLTFSASRYLLPGKYTLLASGFIFPVNKDNSIGSIEILPPKEPVTNIDVKVQKGKNGQPAIFIDEEPVHGMFSYYYNSMEEARGMRDAGVRLSVVSPSRISRSWWKGYGEYDLAGYEKLLREILEMNPDTYLVLEIGIDLYLSWWLKQHPEERVLLSNGELCPSYAASSADSFASEIGLRDSKKFVYDIVSHFENSPFREKIMGYRFMKGGGGEWYMWYPKHVNSFLLVPPFADHSKPMIHAFQKYLQTKYGNIENLANAWNRDVSDFKSIAIPSDEEIMQSGFGVFRDLQKEQPVVDYFEALADINTNYIETVLKSARDASNGKKFLNIFYGYTFEFWEPRQVFSGHMGLNKLLNSGLLDSLSAPHAYFNRHAGGTGAFMLPVDSIRHKGMLYWDDSDFRTHLSTINSPHDYLPQDSVSTMWRNFMIMSQKNFAYQWHPFGQWFSGPEILDAIGDMNKLADQFITEEKGTEEPLLVPEKERIAIVVSEKAPFVMGLETKPTLIYYLLTLQREVFPDIGAPFDMLLLEELLEREEMHYKAYVFLNAFSLTEKQRHIIKEKLQKDGNVLTWVYAPGIYQDQEFGETFMKDLTGISLKIDESEKPLQVKINNTEHPLTSFSSTEDIFGNRGEKVSPIIYSDDAEAISLGTLVSGKQSGIAVKDMGDWTSVFVAVPGLPASLLRGICKLAGVHLYSTQNLAMYPNRRRLTIYPAQYTSTEINFPEKVKLFDVMNNSWTGEDFSEKHHLNLHTNKPYIYQLHYQE